MNKKTVTRYFPAGMTLRNNDFQINGTSASKSTNASGEAKTDPNIMTRSHSPPKNVNKSEINIQKQLASHTMLQKSPEPETEHENSTDTSAFEASTRQTCFSKRTVRESMTGQNQAAPPKTICRRSKSVKKEGLNLNVNKYSVYSTNIKSIKISDVHSNDISGDEKCRTADAMDDGLCPSSKVENHFKNKRDDHIQRSVQLQRSKSAVHLKYTASPKNEVTSTSRNGLVKSFPESAAPKDEKVVKFKNASSRMSEKKQCDCENCDNFINCITWCDNNIKFEKSVVESVVRKGLPLLKAPYTLEKPLNIKKVYKNNILVQGAFIEKPVGSLMGTSFNENVKKAVNNMNCSAKTLQSYTWPLIQRRLHVIMVGPPQSGKTFSYLPAICTFAVEKSEKYLELSKYEGPLIVILCLNSEKCNQLKKLIDFVIEESWEDMTVEILNDPATKINCDILVTVPSALEEALKSERVKLKRLCHLVMEDTDLVLKNYPENVGRLLKILNEIQLNRPHNKKIQVIVSTEKWTVDIEHLMKTLYVSPTIIFEDFLQAAFYSNINFVKKKLLNSAHKKFYLEDILKKQYSTHRSIVFCQEFEIPEVQEYLEFKGIECILISNDLIEDEIFENEDMWCSLKMGRYKVLLCTDALFEKTVRILNANWLIHYSLPSDWNTFQKRFRCLSQHFSSSLETRDNHEDTYSFLIGVADAASENIFTIFLNMIAVSYSKHLQLTKIPIC